MMRHGLSVMASGLLAAGVAATADGQVAAGGNGRALDANPQAGGGRVNAIDPNQTIDYAARNNLITGNVAGGRGFQGEVPYSAPGEFGFNRAASQSNSLFDFSARSLPSAPQVQGAAFIGGATDASIGVYSNYNSVNTARIGQSYRVGGTASGIGEVVRFSPDTSFDATPSTQTVGFSRGADGGLNRLIASPLLGVRQTPVEPIDPLAVPSQPGATGYQSDEQDEPVRGQGQVSGEFVPQVRDADGNTIPGRPGEPLDAEDDATDGRSSLDRLDRRLGYFTGRSSLTADAVAERQRNARSPLGLMLGRQIRRQFDPTISAAGVTQDRLAAESARLAEQTTARGQGEAEGDDEPLSAYDRLLQSARERAAGESVEDEGRAEAQRPDPLDGPSDSALSDAERARRDILINRLGFDEDALDPQATRDLIQGAGVGDILGLIDYDLPAIESMAEATDARAREAIESAESSLAEGAYVEAERQYGRAQQLRPDDPLVRVGLVHAQLGAGMYRSAAFNLRQVFAEHPELIAARYAARLLPQQRRLEQVSTELQRLASQPRSASDAGVLLAYLGYQTESPTLTRFGLAVTEANDTRQDLLPLLREIWLDDADPALAPSSSPDADAATEPTDG